jgi:hypothetical protein
MDKEYILKIVAICVGFAVFVTIVILSLVGVFDSWESRKLKAKARYEDALNKLKPDMDDSDYNELKDCSKFDNSGIHKVGNKYCNDNNEAGFLKLKSLLEALRDYKICEILADRIKQLDSKKNLKEKDFIKFFDDHKVDLIPSIQADLIFFSEQIILHGLSDLEKRELSQFWDSHDGYDEKVDKIRESMKKNPKIKNAFPQLIKTRVNLYKEFIGYLEDQRIIHPTQINILGKIPEWKKDIAYIQLSEI